jgi:predicted Zn finger-like uncharacterized protein
MPRCSASLHGLPGFSWIAARFGSVQQGGGGAPTRGAGGLPLVFSRVPALRRRDPVIIACTQCHTRFKVPAGKVTARGLKVRCSRCGHTFRIYPDSAAERGDDPAPAAARPRGPDPFDTFGPEGTSEMEKTPLRGRTVSALLGRMDPGPTEEDFDVDDAGVEPAWNFPPAPSRPAAAAAAATAIAWELEPPAGPPQAVLARGPLPVRPLPPEPEPPSMENTELELDTAPVAGPVVPVHPHPPSSESGLAGLFEAESSPGPPPGPPGTVPLGDELASLAGFTPAWGLAAPSRALSMDGTLSNHTPSLSPASDPESPPPAPQFGGEGTVLDDLPSLEPSELPAHGELELDPGTGTPDWSEASPTSLGGNEIELVSDLPSVELDRHPAPEPEVATAADLSWSVPVSSAPPAPEAASSGGGWSFAPLDFRLLRLRSRSRRPRTALRRSPPLPRPGGTIRSPTSPRLRVRRLRPRPRPRPTPWCSTRRLPRRGPDPTTDSSRCRPVHRLPSHPARCFRTSPRRRSPSARRCRPPPPDPCRPSPSRRGGCGSAFRKASDVAPPGA